MLHGKMKPKEKDEIMKNFKRKNSMLPFPTPAQHDLIVLTRPGQLTYVTDENGNGALNTTRPKPLPGIGRGRQIHRRQVPEELESSLVNNGYHLATGWLSPGSAPDLSTTTPPIFQTRDILLQHEASCP